jgi:proteasome lid subunit RPN8/RPN11
MPVHRETPLPVGEPRQRLIVPAGVARDTQAALRCALGPDGRHEGLVLWAGRRSDGAAVAVQPIVPPSNHGVGHVLIDERAVGLAHRKARQHGLVIVAQVHSHPGDDTRHSEGDDTLIATPYEGYFSVVVGRYGDAGFGSAGVHEYQDRRWVFVSHRPHEPLVILPAVDLAV